MARVASHQRAHAREQFLERKRFHDVVVGANVESSDARFHSVARRENDDWRTQLVLAQGGNHLEPVSARQTEIHHHEIEVFGGRTIEGGLACALQRNIVLLRLQTVSECLADLQFVFDHEHTHLFAVYERHACWRVKSS